MIDQEQQRDYAEETYWLNYCPECDTSPCAGWCLGDRDHWSVTDDATACVEHGIVGHDHTGYGD